MVSPPTVAADLRSDIEVPVRSLPPLMAGLDPAIQAFLHHLWMAGSGPAMREKREPDPSGAD
jgi:hypothetical protein